MHDANVIVLDNAYNGSLTQKDGIQDTTLVKRINQILNNELIPFGFRLHGEIEYKEYLKNMTKDVSTYIKVKQRKSKQQDENIKMIKILNTVELFEKYRSIKYFHYTTCKMDLHKCYCPKCKTSFKVPNYEGNQKCNKCKTPLQSKLENSYTLIWFNFHYGLHECIPEFHRITTNVASKLSLLYNTSSMTLRSSSKSRQSDVFFYFYKGKKSHDLSGKGALTEVRETYGIDVNDVYRTIDYNIALYFSNEDYTKALKAADIVNKKINDIQLEGSDEQFKADVLGEIKLESMNANREIERTVFLMRKEYIGTIIFMKLGIAKLINQNEKFG